jgi:hypothetical protein
MFRKYKHTLAIGHNTVWNHPPSFNNAFMENMSHLNLVRLATTYDVIRGREENTSENLNVSGWAVMFPKLRAVHLAK